MRLRNAWLTRLGAYLFARWVQLVFRTLRLDLRTEVPHTNPYEPTGDARYLYAVWHDSMIVPAFGGSQHATAALTSRHQDGSFVALVLRAIGMQSVRGSTNHGGADALRKLLAVLEHKNVVITPDGPRGPRRVMSRGMVFLASHSGRAIVPTASCCSSAWYVKGSWTELMIPRPFARVVLLAGAPIAVPQDLAPGQLAQITVQVQQAMDELDVKAAAILASYSGRTAASVRVEPL